ncbi:3-galactosyl-N-acetylglucosaminide 4-alpha-L-fucosyltransferase FUT3-like [Elgaria multicarinata webbii]|uniref:3-galactosyl-N-acetylglucosaminide 4-alpha-L-fucosyltransferase FUT3-like n=1 Tax=Elgaria multicarinata webbii TaxID=159646 RepID=UPI002FCD6A92
MEASWPEGSAKSKRQTRRAGCWKFLSLVLLQVLISMMVVVYIRNCVKADPSASEPSPLLEQPRKGSCAPARRPPEITILLWTWPFKKSSPLPKCGRVLGFPDCRFTLNRSWYPRADVVIIHHRDVYHSPMLLPKGPRPPSQRWVWLNLESPYNSYNLHFMDNLFNLTMTYRRDSDIFSPYGWLEVLQKPRQVIVPPKSKLVAWVISNWKPNLRRTKYYQVLRQHVHVDVYGHGHMPLPKEQHYATLSQYKFYLAFENSIHEDYITEKLWKNALAAETVPVVLGPPRSNYERYLPPDAFIHVDDFPTPQQLADFLHRLDRDPIQYQRYFQWRSQLKPFAFLSWHIHYCKACWALQSRPTQYQTVRKLSMWFR